MLLCSCAPFVFALNIPPQPSGYINDYAGMLSAPAKVQLEEKLRQFEQETSNQVVVATFLSLDGGSLEDFSIRLAEAWKIGQKGKDNGVIVSIFKKDRAVRIEAGYGLEGVLTDAISRLIIENQIVPNFRKGDYDRGVEEAVDAIIAVTQGEYQAEPRKQENKTALFVAAVFFLMMLIILLRMQEVGATTFSTSGRRWGRRGFYTGGGFSGGGFRGGGGSFGGGGASGRW